MNRPGVATTIDGHQSYPKLTRLAALFAIIGEFALADGLVAESRDEIARSGDAAWNAAPVLCGAFAAFEAGRPRLAAGLDALHRSWGSTRTRCSPASPPTFGTWWTSRKTARPWGAPDAPMINCPFRSRTRGPPPGMARRALADGDRRRAAASCSRWSAPWPRTADCPLDAAALHADAFTTPMSTCSARPSVSTVTRWREPRHTKTSGPSSLSPTGPRRGPPSMRPGGIPEGRVRARRRARYAGGRGGVGARAASPARPPALGLGQSHRDRLVARAVAEGLTNAKAAERLFLSRHTVDFHLRQIYCKLGISSRGPSSPGSFWSMPGRRIFEPRAQGLFGRRRLIRHAAPRRNANGDTSIRPERTGTRSGTGSRRRRHTTQWR